MRRSASSPSFGASQLEAEIGVELVVLRVAGGGGEQVVGGLDGLVGLAQPGMRSRAISVRYSVRKRRSRTVSRSLIAAASPTGREES